MGADRKQTFPVGLGSALCAPAGIGALRWPRWSDDAAAISDLVNDGRTWANQVVGETGTIFPPGL
jgi:hypothetical protein